jgi:hypothetical protein
MYLMHLLLIIIDADMKTETGSTRQYLEALSLKVPCQGSWSRCQTYLKGAPRGHLPLISTIPVARITAHATVLGFIYLILYLDHIVEVKKKRTRANMSKFSKHQLIF